MSKNSSNLRQKIGSWFLLSVFLLLIASTLVLGACSSAEKELDDPAKAFELAQQYEKDERFEEAIRRFNEIRNKFPYSKFATMAELAVADTYFKQESFAEAQVAYQSFKELHPKHERIDYVTYRIGLSYFEQLPSSVDRDLTLAKDAILHFEDVVRQHPNSIFAKEAAEKKKEAKTKLAGKEEYIADFYFKKGMYESALARYEGLYQNYPGLGFESKALRRAVIAAKKNGDLEKAKTYEKILKQRFPDADGELTSETN